MVCENGEFREIIIDDYFPYNDSKKKPAFCHSSQNELWVMILEKVWAKINENYEQIIGGSALEVLHDFTGAPVESIFTDKLSTS